jgi:hypothetical protein
MNGTSLTQAGEPEVETNYTCKRIEKKKVTGKTGEI